MEHSSIITPSDLEGILCDETADPQPLPLSLLKEITDAFSDEQRIGNGGFAVVYKGKLLNRTVAVKRMFKPYMHEKEYMQEVDCLMRVKHKNIVRFLGYCADTQGTVAKDNGKFIMADVLQRLLCFEYLPKGSLHEYITDTSHRLQWRDRYQIVTGICQGLHYLHQINIVHLDLKPANILLDDNFVPKIADFGLSRWFEEMQSRFITLKAGTLGYMAPEFCHTEIKYRHSPLLDIYSMGVIILEILTGNKELIGNRELTRNMAVDTVVESWSNMVEKSQSGVQMEQVRVCAEIGMECTDPNPEKRPDTQYIISRLDEIKKRDGYIETGVITSQQAEDAPNELHQDTPNAPGETSHKENATALDFVLTVISRRNLKQRIEMVESTVSEVEQSPLLAVASQSTLNGNANKKGSQIRPIGRVIGDKAVEMHNQVRPKDEDTESQRLKVEAQTLIVAHVLITTVATVAFLRRAYRADDHTNGGTPARGGSYVFDAFIMANVLAIICSTLPTIGLAFAATPIVNLITRNAQYMASVLMSCSITCMSVAFALGVYMVPDPVAPSTAIAVCVIIPVVLNHMHAYCFCTGCVHGA